MGLEDKLQQVKIDPLKMSKEERLREAEILNNASPDELKSMFSQVRETKSVCVCICVNVFLWQHAHRHKHYSFLRHQTILFTIVAEMT
jgi:hypothetical protein